MTVAYKIIRESFTTRVTLDRERLTIQAEYLDGPFRYLDSVWRFEPRGARRLRSSTSPSTTSSARAPSPC